MAWVGILIGLALAAYTAKRGLYESWALLFNILISIYLTIALTPFLIGLLSLDSNSALSNTLVMLITAIVAFAVLYGSAYMIFLGQFNVSFPKLIDVFGGGFLGFLSGMLIWAFVAFLICASPLASASLCKKLGMERSNAKESIASVVKWSNIVHTFIGSSGKKGAIKEIVVKMLDANIEPEKPQPKKYEAVKTPKDKPVEKPKLTEPNDTNSVKPTPATNETTTALDIIEDLN